MTAKEKITTKMLCELGYIKYYHSSNEIIFIKKDEDYIVNIIHFDLIHKTILKYKTQFDTTNQEELKAFLKAEKELGWC